MENISHSLTAVILAAGKGTRMKSSLHNKVTLPVGGIPMISLTIKNLREAGIKHIIVVVGFAKESVISLLDSDIKVIEQKKHSGTAGAVMASLDLISDTEDVLVVNGDDSFGYSKNLYDELYEFHKKSHAAITLLTVFLKNPHGAGRIIRNADGTIEKIVEDHEAEDEQKSISEVNSGCYIFSADFLHKNIYNIVKSEKSGEYYLTDLVNMAHKQKGIVVALKKSDLKWKGVNSPEDLSEAQKMI